MKGGCNSSGKFLSTEDSIPDWRMVTSMSQPATSRNQYQVKAITASAPAARPIQPRLPQRLPRIYSIQNNRASAPAMNNAAR